MSKPEHPPLDGEQTTKQQDPTQLYPIVSAADVGRSNYGRVWFDEHIAESLEQHARGRAPSDYEHSDRVLRNHLMGVASEVATATWRNGQIDRRILPDYEGDGGIDVTAQSRWREDNDRYQVKATRDMKNPERNVSSEELEKADIFVLCCTDAPKRYVEIVGYIHQPILEKMNKTYGRDGYLLTPEILYPVEPQQYMPDKVREAMYR